MFNLFKKKKREPHFGPRWKKKADIICAASYMTVNRNPKKRKFI